MTARKAWTDLTPAGREQRIAKLGLSHQMPRTDRPMGTFATLHAKCTNGAGCTGPGCRRVK